MATGESATLDVSAYFRDPDGGTLTYTAASSDEAVVSTSLSGSTLTMEGVAEGTATVTVTAQDPDELTVEQSFDVTVEAPNNAPEAVGTIADQTVAAEATQTVDVSEYFQDADGDDLTYEAMSSDDAIATASVEGSTLTITGVAAGDATVTVTAQDPDGLTAEQSFDVTVEAANNAPEAVGTMPDQAVETGATETVDVYDYFQDADGDVLTYSAASSNDSVATASVEDATLTIAGVAAGSATVTVTAQDPGGLTATQSFDVAVEDRAPGFNEQFDSSASLEDWNVRNDGQAEVTDGVLHLTNGGNLAAIAVRSIPAAVTSWTMRISMGLDQDAGLAAVWWGTGSERYQTIAFDVGTLGPRNFTTWLWDDVDQTWLFVEALSGHSDAVNTGAGELTEITIAWNGEEASIHAGETELVRWEPSAAVASLLEYVTYAALVVDEVNAPGLTALFDYVELTGTEVGAGGAAGPQVGPQVAPPIEALRAAKNARGMTDRTIR